MSVLDTIKSIKVRFHWKYFIFCLLMVFILFPANFEMYLYPLSNIEFSWQTLDPSWTSTLNYVSLNNYVWGEDFAFTLGPLSYLLTRVGWGHNAIDFIVYDLFVSLNFFLIFYITLIKNKKNVVAFIFIISIVLLLPVYFGSITSFILLSFLLFWIKQSLASNNILYYFFQITLVSLLFFIKLNTGLVSVFFFTMGILYKIVLKKDSIIKLSSVFVFQIVALLVLSLWFNVRFLAYIKSALEIVSGYNDVMYLKIASLNSLYIVIAMVVLILIYLCYTLFSNYMNAFLKTLFLTFLLSSSVFILFKQSFVRADESHIKEFFYCFLFLAFTLLDFSDFKKNMAITILLISLPILTFVGLNTLEINYLNSSEKLNKSNYYSGFKDFTPVSSIKLFPNNNQLPQRINDKIALDSIDSYPWNTQILLENKLMFYPRPVFQSYTTYTSYLQEKNFNYYNSTKAPKFVLYDYDAIDNRYALFDDSMLNLVLLKNYHCVDTFQINKRPTLLLERKKIRKKIELVQTDEYAMFLDDPLVPKKDTFYKIYLYDNSKGKVVSMLYRGSEITLKILLDSGESKEYRTSSKLLEAGVFLDEFIANTTDFKKVLGKEINEKNEIRAYFFDVKNKSFFKDKIRIKEFKIKTENE